MPDWSIKIVPAPHPSPQAQAGFMPDLHGAKPGDPLQAQVADDVSWNNTTQEPHWPWPANANFQPLPDSQVPRGSENYLSDEISPGGSSRPTYSVVIPASGSIIYYCCKLHPSEHGTIAVSAIPSATPAPSV